MTPFLRKIASQGLNFLLPPLCLMCDEPVDETSTLCPSCWKKLHFIAPPLCACCGMPFDFSVEDGTLCGNCLNTPPGFHAARAAVLYDDASKELVFGFKLADKTHGAKTLALWMHRAGGTFWETSELLVPVPLHRQQLFRRRYNQASLLANEIGRLTGLPVLHQGLQRSRATARQGPLKRTERQKNVKGAFVAPAPESLAGKSVTLIDDVMTTGATINECTKVLLKAGAREVRALTLARVRSSV